MEELIVKIEAQLKYNNKQLDDINREPNYTCPKIDSIIKEWNYLLNYVSKCEKSLKYTNEISDLENHIKDIDSEVYSIKLEDSLEDLRTQNVELRDWGKSWMSLAEKLLEEKEELLELLLKKNLLSVGL
jgi:hypothetical protein